MVKSKKYSKRLDEIWKHSKKKKSFNIKAPIKAKKVKTDKVVKEVFYN